jgi:hypothetical protein
MLKVLSRLFLALLLLVPLALVAAAVLAFSIEPSVKGGDALTPDLVRRAERLIRAHDPRRAHDGQVRSVQIDGADLNLMASYAASRYGMATTVTLQQGQALVRASLPTRSPFGGYLNITGVVADSAGLPRPSQVTVGRLPIPDWLTERLVGIALRRVTSADSTQLAADMVRSVSMRDGQLRIDYAWRDDAPDRMRALAVSAADAERFRAYHERIVQTLNALPPSQRSLVDLLGPLMQLAIERSADGDAVVENRSVVIALTFYSLGVRMDAVVPDARDWPRPKRRALLLKGRDDLPKHFLVSAVLAATAGTPLSYVVGVYKEIDDSQGGSGFSFSDIAADRAGTTFGERAVNAGAELQARVGRGLTEADLMPEIADLADNMPEAEFTRRFGGVGAPAYNRVIADIDRRVAACRLFR